VISATRPVTPGIFCLSPWQKLTANYMRLAAQCAAFRPIDVLCDGRHIIDAGRSIY
jgi:hypothetical protein